MYTAKTSKAHVFANNFIIAKAGALPRLTDLFTSRRRCLFGAVIFQV